MDRLAQAYAALRGGRIGDARALLASMRASHGDDPAFLRADAALAQLDGRTGDSLDALRRALAMAPHDAGLHLALGQVLAGAGRVDDALDAWRQARELAPHDAAPWMLAGTALLGQGRWRDASTHLRQAASRVDDAGLFVALGEAEYQRERYADALDAFERASRHPGVAGDARVALRRAQCLRGLGSVDAALDLLRAATAQWPSDAMLWLELGGAFEDAGDAAAAIDAYGRAGAVAPDAVEPVALRVALQAEAATADDVRAALSHADDAARPPTARALAHHALGRRAWSTGDVQAARAHWTAANRLRRAVDPPFDRGAYSARIDAIVAAFDAKRLRRLHADAQRDDRPIFVVGMPRSGTTLVERILGAHPAVHALGERTDVPHLAEDIADATDGRWPHAWDEGPVDALRTAARRYLDAAQASTAARIVDKHPYNTLHLGLIVALFAGARVIWCRRDPRDVALSIYRESFGPASAFATDLDDIRHVIAEQARLLRHWRAALPIPLLEVDYEAVVADVEGQSRRLMAFAGLPWDPACLAFHRAPGAVRTMSRWQVRAPVHARSVGGWRLVPEWFETPEWQAIAAAHVADGQATPLRD